MTIQKKQPDPIDVYVGSRIRLRRNLLGVSQERLGEQLGITFQQVQKYEKGTNRVGASRLQAIAETLDAPVSFFFENVADDHLVESFAESSVNPLLTASSDEGVQLIRAFTNIKDPKVRRQIIDLTKTLSSDNRMERM